MKKEFRVIILGLFVLFVFIGAAFISLNKYMDMQTEKDVSEIAKVFLMEKATQETSRFNALMSIRNSQIISMEENLERIKDKAYTELVAGKLRDAAEFQKLANCSLVSDSGEMETLYGEEIVRLGDSDFLMESLRANGDVVITGGWSEKRQMIIYAVPIDLPMSNGEHSIGLLWCKPMSVFEELMNLDDERSQVDFYIIRRDTSYVIRSYEESYESVVTKYVHPEGMTSEEYMEKIRQTISNNGTLMVNTRYIDKERGENYRRSACIMPLENSNWYLLSVMPYGVLDDTISLMGQARTYGMFVALAIITVVLLSVFITYGVIMKRQMKRIEQSREEALAAKEEAINANKAKSDFLSNMSHDIRTPMNAIVGMTAIATEHIDDKDRVKDCLKKITLSGKQLLGLINDVLDMSKIESGKMTLNMDVLSLKETMETLCDIVRPQIKANEQHFDIFISNIIEEEVYSDSVRINQVMLNFLSNAMKYTPKGGYISVSMRQEESPKGDKYVRTFLSVKDSGMGTSEEFRQKLFTAFEREDRRRIHKTQGTGLGLAITKYIVDAMDGTISVESEVGMGSTFNIVIDFEKAEVKREEMKLPDWKILVVDDNEDICRTAAETLKELGTRPDICMNGKDAIEKVVEAEKNNDSYFAVLIDYKMEGLNGVETAKKIRENIGKQIPISIISAYDWSEIEEEAKDAYINGFVSKPLFKSTLYFELRKHMNGVSDTADTLADENEIDISGLRILLAEDNDLNAEIATMILEESDCVIERAEDGKIAADMFENSEADYYDMILMDLRMPNMNGIEATEKIRSMKRPDAETIKIIAMTADAFTEDIQRCLDAGMNAHLSKPIDIDQLKKTLNKFKNDKK
ncbi:MAG: response regulator [Lachnospiraceae bacterium]|nr:response regulator [Lachnospiraceae bacterium]